MLGFQPHPPVLEEFLECFESFKVVCIHLLWDENFHLLQLLVTHIGGRDLEMSTKSAQMAQMLRSLDLVLKAVLRATKGLGPILA